MKMDRRALSIGLLCALGMLLASVFLSSERFRDLSLARSIKEVEVSRNEQIFNIFGGSMRSAHNWEPIPYSYSALFCSKNADTTPLQDNSSKANSSDKEQEEERRNFEKLNLGQLLTSDSYAITNYQISLNWENKLMPACQHRYSDMEIALIESIIRKGYCHYFALGGLDIIFDYSSPLFQNIKTSCFAGIPLGYVEESSNRPVLFNHLDILLKVRKGKEKKEILQVIGTPWSLQIPEEKALNVKNDKNLPKDSVNTAVLQSYVSCLFSNNTTLCPPIYLDLNSNLPDPFLVKYSYRIIIKEVENLHIGRNDWWGYYFFPIMSCLVLLIGVYRLTKRVKSKLLQPLNTYARNSPSIASSVYQLKEEISATPKFVRFLTFIVGMGAQIWFAVFATLELLLFDVLAPPYRGTLLTTFLVFFLLANGIMGYHQGLLEKEMRNGGDAVTPWNVAKRGVLISANNTRKRIAIISNALTSQIVMLGFFLLLILWNTLRIVSHVFIPISSKSIFFVGLMWLLVGLPLLIIGRIIGSQQKGAYYLYDIRFIIALIVGLILGETFGFLPHFLAMFPAAAFLQSFSKNILACKDRKIVITPWHVTSMAGTDSFDLVSSILLFLGTGLFPAMCILIGLRELLMRYHDEQPLYLMTSSYILFVSLATYTVASLLASAFITAIMLLKKDYGSILWRGFFGSGMSTVYVFFYLIHFFATLNLESTFINRLSVIIFVFLVSLMLFLISGSLGFYGCHYFLAAFFASFNSDPNFNSILQLSGNNPNEPILPTSSQNGLFSQ